MRSLALNCTRPWDLFGSFIAEKRGVRLLTKFNIVGGRRLASENGQQ